MKRLIIADVNSLNNKGISTGHFCALAQNYIDAFHNIGEVKAAGGPIYTTRLKKQDLIILPYDHTANSNYFKAKWHTLLNCKYLFSHVENNDVVVMQHSSAVTTFLGIALFAKKTNIIYLIQYSTDDIVSPIHKLFFKFAKRKIKGLLCPFKKIGEKFKIPYLVISDYLFTGIRNQTSNLDICSDCQYDFSMVGRISPEKGIVDVVKKLANTSFKILVAGRPQDQKIKSEIEEAALGASNIELRLGFITDADYYKLIRQSRYCILNYQGAYANDRSSGVVLDMLYNGVPVIGHRCGALQFIEDEGLGFLYDDIKDFNPSLIMNKSFYVECKQSISNFINEQRSQINNLKVFLKL
ncbi:glycosyltransferase [Prevotella sp.]|uniref:glycosyltransferase n=1 Tax=Prevotella sp. TaxID=59823 RepID=UPI003DA3B315